MYSLTRNEKHVMLEGKDKYYMKEFSYTIKDELGIHARPAALLVNEVKKYSSKVTVGCGGRTADASRLMAVMALGVKCGQEVIVTIDGADEEEAAERLISFLEENL